MIKKRRKPPAPSEPQLIAETDCIDLARLRDMHPQLPVDMVQIMVTRAALGLQRNKHASGAEIQMAIENEGHECTIMWPHADLSSAEQHDHNRITEDGAEAIALAVVHKKQAWRVVRRMQRDQHADWLLERVENDQRTLVAFEISGVDQGPIRVRLNEKVGQVAKSIDVDHRWVGVVGFQQPEAAFLSVEVRENDQ